MSKKSQKNTPLATILGHTFSPSTSQEKEKRERKKGLGHCKSPNFCTFLKLIGKKDNNIPFLLI